MRLRRLQFWAGDVSSDDAFKMVYQHVSNDEVVVATTNNHSLGGIDVIVISDSDKGDAFITWALLALDQHIDVKDSYFGNSKENNRKDHD